MTSDVASYLIKNDDETLDKLEYFGLAYSNLMEAGVTDADALRKVTQTFLDTLPTLSTNPLPKIPTAPISDTYFRIWNKNIDRPSAIFPNSYNSFKDAEAAMVRNYYDEKRSGGVAKFLDHFQIREFKRPTFSYGAASECPTRYEIIFKMTGRRSQQHTGVYTSYEDAKTLLDRYYPSYQRSNGTAEDRWSHLYEIRSV